MLAPRDTPSRECRRLDGLWSFAFDAEGVGRGEGWWRTPLSGGRRMPVPSSFNDLVTEVAERDYIGDVWYQHDVYVPQAWRGRRIVLRLDAATHRGTVWVGDTEVADHVGGYLPFEADITGLFESGRASYGAPTRVTVCVNTELTMATIPPGQSSRRPDGSVALRYFHDFYNYGGLHRPVWLYSTPTTYVRDVTVVAGFDAATGTGTVGYRVDGGGDAATSVTLYDADGTVVAEGAGAEGTLSVAQAHPWAPGKPYLYRLEVAHGDDRYPVRVGLRTVRVDRTGVYVNDEPFYFRGFGMHEDSAMRGKGHDDVRMVRDFALLEWIGANSFRTTHYPYAEEILDYADERGLVVIDETPAVGLHLSLGNLGTEGARTFGPGLVDEQTQQAHRQVIRELIARDKNHPCVVAWSVANEPDSAEDGAREYFAPLVDLVRELDPTRVVCFANAGTSTPETDKISDLFDLLCINRYHGWYIDTGDLVSARVSLANDLRGWHERYPDKPILMSEFGADTLAGMHTLPEVIWTEEFQREFLRMTTDVLDGLDFIVGEHVWCFADFATAQMVFRVVGNRKGLFTRERQPKSAAFWLRDRWTARA
ncbi:MAG TPA: beta-glucuronidase [Micromonosporaceae bacterium]|nr:beta-glucuronidase [Micromonosporaceae bacterium]